MPAQSAQVGRNSAKPKIIVPLTSEILATAGIGFLRGIMAEFQRGVTTWSAFIARNLILAGALRSRR